MILLENYNLIKEIGLNHAYVLDKIFGWIMTNARTNRNFRNGEFWTFSTIEVICKRDCPFLNKGTLARILKTLEKKGLLVVNRFNKKKNNRTKWYSINFELLQKLCEKTTNIAEDYFSLCTKKTLSNATKRENGYTQNVQVDVDKKCNSEKNINKNINKSIKTTTRVIRPLEGDELLESMKKRLFYDWLLDTYKTSTDLVKSIFNIIGETMSNKAQEIKIGENIFPVSLIKKRLNMLDVSHIQYIIDTYNATKTIYNTRSFVLNLLFNATTEIDNFYKRQV